MFVGVLNLYSATLSSQNSKISLSLRQASVKQVLKELESKTEYSFLYNDELINVDRKVNVDVKEKELNEVLDMLFKENHVQFRLVDQRIILTPSQDQFNAANQQDAIQVTGLVTDQNGEVLPGVNVFEKSDPTKGVITGIDGSYSIRVSSADAVLSFSYIGFEVQQIQVAGRAKINVTLVEEITGLDEVVVVGYGTTTKRKMVSSVSVVKTDDISEAPYSSVVEGLAGRTGGLFVQSSGGEYGSIPKVSIRGRGKPTYVIDGIIASESEFSMIPASDIEEISFLKDAAATAVYGFNAANGVVLVVTKRGADKEIAFKYNGDFAFQQPTLLPEYMSAYEIAVNKNRAAFNDGLPPVVDDEMLNILKNNLDPVRYPTIDPFDEAVKKYAMQRRHNLTMDGTVKNTKIYTSFDYFGQDGIYKTNDYGLNRYSLRSNISHDMEEVGLQINANVSLQRNLKDAPPVGTWTIWSHVRNWQPGSPMYNPEGNYYGLENPLAEADDAAGYNSEEVNRINARLEAIWNIPKVKGLTVKVVGNYNYDSNFTKLWRANQRNSAPTYTWDNALVEVGKPQLNEWFGRTWKYDLEGHINYLHTFADVHTVELTGVYSQGEAKYDGFNAYRKDFPSPAVDQLFAGSADGKDNSGNASESGRIGYVGRLKYDYDAKYVLEANFRYDGYDAFPEDQRYELFPSVSLGWNIDQEAFMKSIMRTIKMNAFKVRASWGRVGRLGESDAEIAASRFSHLSVYDLINNTYYVNGEWKTGFREGPLTPTAGTTSWYTQESKNLGIDFAFFDNKISGTFDWFYDRTTGYLGSPADRYTTPLGKALPRINTNSAFRRGGIEFSLNYKMNVGLATVNIGGNISNYDQLWEKNYNETEDVLMNPDKRITHQKDYYTLGYIDQGLYQNMDEILDSPRRLGSTETKPGDIRYKDVNGDGRIDGDDFVRIGKNSFPHINYGLNFDVQYAGFTLLALFQGTAQKQMYLGGVWRNEINHILYKVQEDAWRSDNTDALFPRTSSFNNVNGGNNVATSSFWLQDAWYIRMKSLSLSYDFKNSLMENWKAIDGLSLVLSATNLFTISPVNKYYLDPETSSYDNYGYPVGRTYNVGVRVMF